MFGCLIPDEPGLNTSSRPDQTVLVSVSLHPIIRTLTRRKYRYPKPPKSKVALTQPSSFCNSPVNAQKCRPCGGRVTRSITLMVSIIWRQLCVVFLHGGGGLLLHNCVSFFVIRTESSVPNFQQYSFFLFCFFLGFKVLALCSVGCIRE